MLTAILLYGTGTLLLTLIWKMVWARHKLYSSINAAAPKGYPFFGVGLSLLRDPADFVNTVMELFEAFPNLLKAWFGPLMVVGVSKPEYAEIILNHPMAYTKLKYMYKPMESFLGNGLITAPSEIWKKHRKIISPAFNQKILNGYVEIFSEKCSILVEKLEDHAGKGELDVNDLVYKCNMDMTCESMMGFKVNAQTTNSKYHYVFRRLLEIASLRQINLGYNIDIIFKLSSFGKENSKLLTQLFDVPREIIKTKQEEYKNKTGNLKSEVRKQEDYLSCVVSPMTPVDERSLFLKTTLSVCAPKCKPLSDLLIEERSFTTEEIKDEVLTFIMAGTDTTATATGFALVMIGMHPEIQDEILKEVSTVIGREKDIEASDLPDLKYTECVIKETMRLFPPVPFITRHLEKGDIKLEENVTLPKGTSVLFGILPMHRSAEYWPDPLKFDPRRFSPEEVAKRHPYAYLPYSGGPRNCIGYRFAIMAAKTLIASVVRKYKISTSYKSPANIRLGSNIVLKPKDGFKLSIEHRR